MEKFFNKVAGCKPTTSLKTDATTKDFPFRKLIL